MTAPNFPATADSTSLHAAVRQYAQTTVRESSSAAAQRAGAVARLVGVATERQETHAERVFRLRDQWLQGCPTRTYGHSVEGGFAPHRSTFLQGGHEVVTTRGQNEADSIAQAMMIFVADGQVTL